MILETNETRFNVGSLIDKAPYIKKGDYDAAIAQIKGEIQSASRGIESRNFDLELQHRLINVLSDPLVHFNESFYDDAEFIRLITSIVSICLTINDDVSFWTPVLAKLSLLEVQKIKKGMINIEANRICAFITENYSTRARKTRSYVQNVFIEQLEILIKRLKIEAKKDVSVLASINSVAVKYNRKLKLANIFVNLVKLPSNDLAVFLPLKGRNLSELDVDAAQALMLNQNFPEDDTTLRYLEITFSRLNNSSKHHHHHAQKNKFKSFLTFLIKLLAKKNISEDTKNVIDTFISLLSIKLKNSVTSKKERSTVFVSSMHEMLNGALGYLVNQQRTNSSFEQVFGELKNKIFYLVFYLLLADKEKKNAFEQILTKIEILYGDQYADFVIGKLEKIFITDELNNKIIAEHLVFLSHSLLHRGYEDKVSQYIQHFIKQGYSEKDKITGFIIPAYFQLAFYKLKQKKDPSVLEAFLVDCIDKKWIFSHSLDLSALESINCVNVNVVPALDALVKLFRGNSAEAYIGEVENKYSMLFKSILRILFASSTHFEAFYKNIRPDLDSYPTIEQLISNPENSPEQTGQSLESLLYFLNHLSFQTYKQNSDILSKDLEKIIASLISKRKLEELEENKKMVRNFINAELNSTSDTLAKWLNAASTEISRSDIVSLYANDYKKFTFCLTVINLVVFNTQFLKKFGVNEVIQSTIQLNANVVDYISSNGLFDGYLYKILTIQLSYLHNHALYGVTIAEAGNILKESKGIRAEFFDHVAKQGHLLNTVAILIKERVKIARLNQALNAHHPIYIRWLFVLVRYLSKVNPLLFKQVIQAINSRLIDPRLQQAIIETIIMNLNKTITQLGPDEFESASDNITALLTELLSVNSEVITATVIENLLMSIEGFMTKSKEMETKIGFLFSLVIFVIKKAALHQNIQAQLEKFNSGANFANFLPILYTAISQQSDASSIKAALQNIQTNHKDILLGYFTKIQFAILVNALTNVKKQALQVDKFEANEATDIQSQIGGANVSVKRKDDGLFVSLTNFSAEQNFSAPISINLFTKLVDKLKDVLTQNATDFSTYQMALRQILQKAKLKDIMKLFVSDELTLLVRTMFVADAESRAKIISHLRGILKKDEDSWEKTKIAIFAAAYALRSRGLVNGDFDVLIEDYIQVLFDNFKINHFNILFTFIRTITSYNPELNRKILQMALVKNHNRFTMISLLFANNLDQTFNSGEQLNNYLNLLSNLKYTNQNSLIFGLLLARRYLYITPPRSITQSQSVNAFFVNKLIPELDVSSSNFEIFNILSSGIDSNDQSVEYVQFYLSIFSKMIKYFTEGSSDDPMREKAVALIESHKLVLNKKQKEYFDQWFDNALGQATSVHSQLMLIDLFFNHAKMYSQADFPAFYARLARIISHMHIKSKPHFEKRFNGFLKRQTKEVFAWYLSTVASQNSPLNFQIFYHFLLNFKFTALSLINEYFALLNQIVNSGQLSSVEAAKLNEALTEYTYLQTKFINLEDVVIDKDVVFERLRTVETKFTYHA